MKAHDTLHDCLDCEKWQQRYRDTANQYRDERDAAVAALRVAREALLSDEYDVHMAAIEAIDKILAM